MPQITLHTSDDIHNKYRELITDAKIAIKGMKVQEAIPSFLVDCLKAEKKNGFQGLKKYIGKE